MLVVDANIFLLMLDPDAKAPIDKESGLQVDGAKERVEYLITRLSAQDETLLLPAPVLGEALVSSGPKGPALLDAIKKFKCIRIEPFDEMAAIENAQTVHAHKRAGDKKNGVDEPWQKIKVDNQIVAIAKVAGASTLYTNDKGLRSAAESAGIAVFGIADLPLPPVNPQGALNFGDSIGETPESA